MNKVNILQSVETIREQLLGTTNMNVLLSWGINQFAATIFKDMATLKFRVNARLFTGDVLISYNVGADCYEIYLVNEQEERCLTDMAYFDEMGDIIDRNVESGQNAEEYKKFCEGEFQKICAGDFAM